MQKVFWRMRNFFFLLVPVPQACPSGSTDMRAGTGSSPESPLVVKSTPELIVEKLGDSVICCIWMADVAVKRNAVTPYADFNS